DIQIVTGGTTFNLPGIYTYATQAAPSPAPGATTPATGTASPTASSPPSTPAPPATRKFTVANTDGDGANLRDKPDMTTGKIVANIAEGSVVEVTGPAVDAGGHSWYPVQIG